MAKNDKKPRRNIGLINSTLKTINTLMNGVYRATYNTDRNSREAIDQVTKGLEDSITNIISKNNMSDINNIARLYTRMNNQDAESVKQFSQSVNSLFEDPAITSSVLSMYTENKWIKDLDHEYDMILKYMPKLQEALDAKKENVLSADNFSKDFLNSSSKNLTDATAQSLFATRIAKLDEKYKTQIFYEEVYDRVAKYGEEFVYCVPYSTAITDLLKRKGNTRINATHGPSRLYDGVAESVVEIPLIENGVIHDNKLYKQVESICRDNKIELPDNLKITFDNRGFLESAYEQQMSITETLEKTPRSVYESVLEATESKKEFKYDNTIPDKLEVPKDFEDNKTTSTDGFVSLNGENADVKVQGAVLKRLKHENVILIYIEDVCLGYYYIEFLGGASSDSFLDNNHMYGKNNIMAGTLGRDRNFSNEAIQNQRDRLLGYFAGNIANNINARFVHTNQDLTKEIYTILKYNDVFNSQNIDNIRISFLPASDVEHVFFKQDPETHRGISDLAYALFPAKLYACLYITNILGILTRGQDKRVYYVKQNVEQNIAQTMLNVINQIKRGNFGMREIENMNTILNITGKFNDYIIPVGPSGDAPVQFEVMQGQEFNPYTELMEKLEEMSINSTGMPIEFIQNRMQSLDFAVQATTVNSKVLRSTYKRQAIFEFYLSRVETKLYNSEYNENIAVTCSLATPLFLHMTNINQMIENLKQYVQSIADFEYDADNNKDPNNENKKNLFIRNMMRSKLPSYLKLDEIEEMKKMAELEFNMDPPSEE